MPVRFHWLDFGLGGLLEERVRADPLGPVRGIERVALHADLTIARPASAWLLPERGLFQSRRRLVKRDPRKAWRQLVKGEVEDQKHDQKDDQ